MLFNLLRNRKYLLYLVLCMIMLSLIIFSIFMFIHNQQNKFIADELPSYLREIKNNSELAQLINIENNEEIMIYFSRNDCLYCETYLELLDKVYQNNPTNPKNIYYYNTKKQYDYNEKTDEYLSNLGIVTVPVIIKVSNGEVTSKIDNALNVADMEAFIN